MSKLDDFHPSSKISQIYLSLVWEFEQKKVRVRVRELDLRPSVFIDRPSNFSSEDSFDFALRHAYFTAAQFSFNWTVHFYHLHLTH